MNRVVVLVLDLVKLHRERWILMMTTIERTSEGCESIGLSCHIYDSRERLASLYCLHNMKIAHSTVRSSVTTTVKALTFRL